MNNPNPKSNPPNANGLDERNRSKITKNHDTNPLTMRIGLDSKKVTTAEVALGKRSDFNAAKNVEIDPQYSFYDSSQQQTLNMKNPPNRNINIVNIGNCDADTRVGGIDSNRCLNGDTINTDEIQNSPAVTDSMIIKSVLENFFPGNFTSFSQLIEQFPIQGSKNQIPSSFEEMISNGFPSGLDSFIATKHLFIQPKLSTTTTDLEESSATKAFNILNTNGDRLFLVTDTTKSGKKINLDVYGCNGYKIFEIKGTSNSAKVRISNAQTTVASIALRTPFCFTKPYFQVKNVTGKMLYQIEHDYSTQNSYDFNIVTSDGLRIGGLSKTWIGLPRSNQNLAHSFGISFPADTTLMNKTSLLMAAIFLFFRYIEYADLSREQRREACDCILTTIWVVVILVILLILALFIVYTYQWLN